MRLPAFVSPLFLAFVCAVPATVVACGGGGGGDTQTPQNASASATATATTTTSEAALPSAWKDMNHDQRAVFMKRVVMPKMKADFAAYDAKRFGDINCATCHGEGVKDGSFKLPNPALPKMPTTKEAFGKIYAQNPEAVKFMKQVQETVAGMLGEEPFNLQTGKGFSCFNCHPKAE